VPGPTPVEGQPTPATPEKPGGAAKKPALGPSEGEPQPLQEPKVEMPKKPTSEARTPSAPSELPARKKDNTT
jgi:hypothetical protein